MQLFKSLGCANFFIVIIFNNYTETNPNNVPFNFRFQFENKKFMFI